MNIWDLNDADLKKAAKAIKEESRLYGPRMSPLSDRKLQSAYSKASKTTHTGARYIKAWRSRDFLCQLAECKSGHLRLSINRTVVDVTNRRWRDGITWDELMQVKRECGYGDQYAVEVFPADHDQVNVANIRHLWLLPEAPPYAWRKNGEEIRL